MKILRELFAFLVLPITRWRSQKKEVTRKAINSVHGISDIIPTLSENEVVLKKNGSTYEVFSPKKLTGEEIHMIINGKPPEGITVFVI